MPNEESVLLLMGKTAMDKKSYLRPVPDRLRSGIIPRLMTGVQEIRSIRRNMLEIFCEKTCKIRLNK